MSLVECGYKCKITKDCEGFVWRDPSKHGVENNCQLRGGFIGHNPVETIKNCADSGDSGFETYFCKQPGGTLQNWQGCDSSSICINPYAFCRVGDKRCLTDGQCAWANSADNTNRDCTPIPLASNLLSSTHSSPKPPPSNLSSPKPPPPMPAPTSSSNCKVNPATKLTGCACMNPDNKNESLPCSIQPDGQCKISGNDGWGNCEPECCA